VISFLIFKQKTKTLAHNIEKNSVTAGDYAIKCEGFPKYSAELDLG